MLPTDAQRILRGLMENGVNSTQGIEHVLLCGTPELARKVLLPVVPQLAGLTMRPILPSSVSVPSQVQGVMLRTCSALSLETPGDMAVVLTHLRSGDILFIDAIHRLCKPCTVLLSRAMITFALHIEAESKALDLALSQFMVIGATSRPSLLIDSLKQCFTQQLWLRDYPNPTSILN
jgi:Holliday junction resolvasome RuvABC ATP-dependent DNA helicase subunit